MAGPSRREVEQHGAAILRHRPVTVRAVRDGSTVGPADGEALHARRLLDAGPVAIHQTLLFRQLSEDATFFPHRMPDPGAEEWERLAALGVQVVEDPVRRLRIEEDALRAVVLDDGQDVPVDALAVAPRVVAGAAIEDAAAAGAAASTCTCTSAAGHHSSWPGRAGSRGGSVPSWTCAVHRR